MRKQTSCSSSEENKRPKTFHRKYHLILVLFSTLPVHSLLLHILVSHQHIPSLPSAAALQPQSDHSGGSSAVPGCHHKIWGPSSVSEPNGWNVWCPDTWKIKHNLWVQAEHCPGSRAGSGIMVFSESYELHQSRMFFERHMKARGKSSSEQPALPLFLVSRRNLKTGRTSSLLRVLFIKNLPQRLLNLNVLPSSAQV